MNRIKELRERAGLSQRALAKKLGISHVSVSLWENGKSVPNGESLLNLSYILQASVDELLGLPTYKITASEHRVLPLLGSISAGTPLEAVEILDHIEVPGNLADKYPDAFVLQVTGDSMDKVIPDGAYVVVTPDVEPAPHSIVAACVNGYEATIKRYYKLPSGTVVLSPESHNPQHVEYVVHPPSRDEDDQTAYEEGVHVLGRVVYVFSLI